MTIVFLENGSLVAVKESRRDAIRAWRSSEKYIEFEQRPVMAEPTYQPKITIKRTSVIAVSDE